MSTIEILTQENLQKEITKTLQFNVRTAKTFQGIFYHLFSLCIFTLYIYIFIYLSSILLVLFLLRLFFKYNSKKHCGEDLCQLNVSFFLSDRNTKE